MTESLSSLQADVAGQGGWKQFNEERVTPIKKYALRNPSLIVGSVLLFGMLFLVGLGHLVWETEMFRPLSAPTRLGPTGAHPFGTDTQGRDLLAVAILGTPLTLRIGLIAGGVAIGLGTVAAFLAAYYRGVVDGAIRSVVDVGLAMPALLILILVRINIGRELSTDELGIAIGLTSWVFPARTIRSQVLVMREQAYVELSRLSGTSGMGIIFKEMMPNLIPYITASLVGSVAGAILASIGLEAIGLGNLSDPTLGMTIYWNIQFSSITLGMWWWWLPPLAAIVIVFVSLFLISSGLDEWSNPRLRKRV
ncbi:MAG: ABC transporter permease [Chloroflexi bacterium]|jgi:peptide/nickel transport system permease protein|nr:ABC transporter permease [Chloroflexota bacterium]MBT5627940.1 ABC transporter permease [Chloroflexota bacterium]MBT7077986.1 ABC transporter permease [Chloroflexota bacterium]